MSRRQRVSWADQHLPGLGPAVGPLDARYSRWLGACAKCRASTLTVTNRNGSTYLVDPRPREGGNLALAIHDDSLRAEVPATDERMKLTFQLYHRHQCKRPKGPTPNG